ncbi:ATP-binding protein [Lysinibacillus sp. NPDC096418]|uniref:ATP-binding protein n=1 Tax=Lysinibacillus sp. NPDC096418 TaxID=3364138 RepID=UPI0038028AB5
MDFTLNLVPNQQAIYFVDATMASYTNLFNIPNKKELCFVVHELVINAIEAMKNTPLNEGAKIQVHVSQNDDVVKVTVIDQAEGIPIEEWDKVLQFNLDSLTFSDRGRGLFFVKSMVDEIWFENISDTKFLVGISKKINI